MLKDFLLQKVVGIAFCCVKYAQSRNITTMSLHASMFSFFFLLFNIHRLKVVTVFTETNFKKKKKNPEQFQHVPLAGSFPLFLVLRKELVVLGIVLSQDDCLIKNRRI